MLPQFNSILVATDFSQSSARTLDYAKALAGRFDAALHLLHVVEDPVITSAWSEAYALDMSGLQGRMRQDAERRLGEMGAALASTGIKVTTEVLIGPAARTIVGAAGDRASDLIVMGTHGRSGISHLLLGSVAERVVRMATCPVLTVRAVMPVESAPARATASQPVSA